MNVRMKRLMMDMSLAILLSIALALLMNYGMLAFNFYLALGIIPIIWIGLRYGVPAGIVSGFIAGSIVGLVLYRWQDFLQIIFMGMMPLMVVGIAGLFAKYTQKTLNNHRYASTYLNIATASLVASLLYYLIAYGLVPYAFGESSLFPINELQFWLSMILTFVISFIILIVLARLVPTLIIPPRSQFLSRKETTSLLND